MPMLDDYLNWTPWFEILPMDGDDCHEASVLHGQRFARRWSESEVFSLLSQENVFGQVARQTNAFFSKPFGGFVMAREAGGEAEILTIAVSDKFGRTGLGWRLMQAAMREAEMRGAGSIFLEVDDGNRAALALYRKLGFETVGNRPAYYTDAQGRRTSALVMRRDLR